MVAPGSGEKPLTPRPGGNTRVASASFRISFPTMAHEEWIDPVTEAYKRGVDRTLLRKNLRLTPEERILAAMELQKLAEEVRRAGREARSERTKCSSTTSASGAAGR